MTDIYNDDPTPQNKWWFENYVHIIGGMSKDFGLSGFRIGWLYTKNKELFKTFETTGYDQGISTHT